MKRQIGFAEAESLGKKRVTKRQRFLAEMEKVVPWQRLLLAIGPYYPKGERGRPPVGLERMLRIYFLQQWYGLSDEGLEDALYDSIAMRAFAGIDLARENVPDSTTLLKFRRLLVEHELTRKLFDEIGIELCERGLMTKEGTLVDATIFEAPPSTILRRLGSESTKNKLYFAFRELGRVIRTLFLLKYLNEPDLRRTIHAATNKSEQFNNFAQWLMFGGEGVIAENVRHEQRKVIKYNHLVANMVILYNVQWMSRKLKELQEKGHPVDAEVLKVLSPYRREHINRFGDYLLDLLRSVPPLDPTIDFAFKSAA